MRCVASSPSAAVQALRTRAGLDGETPEEEMEARIFDGAADALPDDDVEPPAAAEDGVLAKLIKQAEDLAGQSGDPKLKACSEHVSELVKDGFNPVVFCRYIATAHYLGKHFTGRLKDVAVGVVTGELTSDERKEKVDLLGDAEQRLLIATDCLSEGVNLQDHFDAVVHYDLSWNPTRHEQREGRVDRFGQKGEVKDPEGRSIVRTTLLYGVNNPVDGAVLEVILRKAEKIRQELGVPVPLPDDGHTMSQALMKAVLLRKRDRDERRQRAFEFVELEEAKAIETRWRDAADKAKRNRAVFAQRRLKPEDVLPEWQKSLAALGGKKTCNVLLDARLHVSVEGWSPSGPPASAVSRHRFTLCRKTFGNGSMQKGFLTCYFSISIILPLRVADLCNAATRWFRCWQKRFWSAHLAKHSIVLAVILLCLAASAAGSHRVLLSERSSQSSVYGTNCRRSVARTTQCFSSRKQARSLGRATLIRLKVSTLSPYSILRRSRILRHMSESEQCPRLSRSKTRLVPI
jgi:hypothetical protein